MEPPYNRHWENFFLGFSIVATLSGLYLLSQGDYVIGAGGAITGLFLTYLNIQKRRSEQSE